MLKMLTLSSLVAMSSFAVANEPSEVDKGMDMPMASYAVGVQSGILLNDNIKRSAEVGIALDKEKVIAGFVDGLYDKSKLTYEEALPYLQQLDTAMKEKEKAMMAKFSEENKAAGKRFMEQQAELGNVKSTLSGLQYKVIKSGNGNRPDSSSTVRVHYKGTLIDGTQFDSSYDRGEPAEFKVDGVIEGWTEMLQLMSEGGMVEVTMPSSLAYGEEGTPNIPPGATLVFIIELLEVK